MEPLQGRETGWEMALVGRGIAKVMPNLAKRGGGGGGGGILGYGGRGVPDGGRQIWVHIEVLVPLHPAHLAWMSSVETQRPRAYALQRYLII